MQILSEIAWLEISRNNFSCHGYISQILTDMKNINTAVILLTAMLLTSFSANASGDQECLRLGKGNTRVFYCSNCELEVSDAPPGMEQALGLGEKFS